MSARFLGVLALLLLCNCTERNKIFCGDGTCVDPALPYCDQDGSLAGVPNTCIAIDCQPGELVACRGDVALTCTAMGNDLDETQCPLGCDAAAKGCRQCKDNAQCTEAAPICDVGTSTCRGCAVDDDCESRVCDRDTGTCTPETSIVYATAENNLGNCSRGQPCPLANAITLATNRVPPPIVRMLPGTYTTPLEITNPTATPLRVVGTGATMLLIGDVGAIVANSGANVDVRDLASTSAIHIQCGATSGAITTLLVRDAVFTSAADRLQIETTRCTLRLDHVDISYNAASTLLGTHDDSTVEADRVIARGNSGSSIVFSGARQNIRITNSLLDDVQLVSFTNDSAPPGSQMVFAFDTFVQRTTNARHQLCGTTVANRSVIFENSISAPLGAFDAFLNNPAAGCTFASTILGRQATPPAGAIVADPLFVDVAGGDFHLGPTSPGVDAATPASIDVDHDVDGNPRPQGSKPDIGAYERAP